VPEQHFTKPPPRYTEASLVKKMEEEGIGRPSTYAPTISTVQQRGYIRKDAGKLFPEDIAFTVTDLLAEHFPNIVDLTFTAQMEQSLDDIAEGTVKGAKFLSGFFSPFKELVELKTKEIKKGDVMKEREIGTDPATGLPVIVRTGRFGPYVQLGRLEPLPKGKRKKGEGPKTASLPKNCNLDTVTLEQALPLLAFPRTLGDHNGAPLQVLLGRFGPYIKAADGTAALPPEKDPSTVTLAEAIQCLTDKQEQKKKAATPRKDLGKDPETGSEILVKDGRFGPYVTDGKTNASVPKASSPETITLEEASALLMKKRAMGPRKAWRKKK
ncbi:DNA topoisomerase I, partial [Candidatus Peregrinibacteria bacterium]|nr:DNA topoisomerase I [Candidatus Peregrinibacteria bacterium]